MLASKLEDFQSGKLYTDIASVSALGESDSPPNPELVEQLKKEYIGILKNIIRNANKAIMTILRSDDQLTPIAVACTDNAFTFHAGHLTNMASNRVMVPEPDNKVEGVDYSVQEANSMNYKHVILHSKKDERNVELKNTDDVFAQFYNIMKFDSVMKMEPTASKIDGIMSDSPVRKMCKIFEKYDVSYFAQSDIFKLELGTDHDFNGRGKYTMIGAMNLLYREDRGPYYRADQNAYQDIVFKYLPYDKTGAFEVIVPFNEDIDELIMRYSILLASNGEIQDDTQYPDTFQASIVAHILNFPGYFNLGDFTLPEVSVSMPSGVKRFYDAAVRYVQDVKNGRMGNKSFDTIVDDSKFAYFAADCPFWRGHYYYPGEYVRNLVVYGSPYLLEKNTSEFTMAMRRYLYHKIYEKFVDMVLHNEQFVSFSPLQYIPETKLALSVVEIPSINDLKKSFRVSPRFSKATPLLELFVMLFYTIVVQALSKQAIKKDDITYPSHLVGNRLSQMYNVLKKVSRVTGILYGVAFEYEYVSKKDELDQMFDPVFKQLYEKSVEKYIELTNMIQELWDKHDIAIINA